MVDNFRTFTILHTAMLRTFSSLNMEPMLKFNNLGEQMFALTLLAPNMSDFFFTFCQELLCSFRHVVGKSQHSTRLAILNVRNLESEFHPTVSCSFLKVNFFLFGFFFLFISFTHEITCRLLPFAYQTFVFLLDFKILCYIILESRSEQP